MRACFQPYRLSASDSDDDVQLEQGFGIWEWNSLGAYNAVTTGA